MVVQANKTIKVLSLRRNKIGDAGMLPLGDALKVDFVLFRELLLTAPGNTTILGVWLYRRTA